MELCLYEDCKLLFHHFLESGELHFKSFCQSWHHNTFYRIWSAQKSYIEIMQTTAAMLHFAKRSACGLDYNGQPMPFPDEKQAHAFHFFGIYLMYAIFFKQPTKAFVKIEVSPNTWSTLRGYVDGLQQTCNSREASETCYIFWKLVKADAFRYTAHDFCLGLEGLINYDNPPKKPNKSGATANNQETHTISNLKTDLPLITKTAAMLAPLETLERKYNQMKHEISLSDPNAQALPTTSTMAKDLGKTLDNIVQFLAEPTTSKNTENDSLQLVDRRRKIKLNAATVIGNPKAKSNQSKTSNAKMEIGSDSDEDENIDVKEVISEDLRQRRSSAHTIFLKKLPISISEEVDSHITVDAGKS